MVKNTNGMVKNTKTWVFWEQNITFPRNKKVLNLCLIWHILRSYCFEAEVTFNAQAIKFNFIQQVWLQYFLIKHEILKV